MRLKTTLVSTLLLSLMTLTISMAPVYSGGPYGPRTDNMLIHIYLNPDFELVDLEPCVLDIADAQLTAGWIDWFMDNPDIRMKDYAKLEIFDFDLNNQRWPTGVTLPREYDPCSGTYKHFYGTNQPWDDIAREFRRALAHLTDKDRYIAEVLGGYGYRIDSKVPIPALAGWTDYAHMEEKGLIYYYDPCMAAAILDAAGFVEGEHPNPFYDPAQPCSAQFIRTDPLFGGDLAPLEFYIRWDDWPKSAAAEMLVEELQMAGIPVNVHLVPRILCYRNVMMRYHYHIYTSNFFVGPDVDYLEWLFHSQMYYGGSEVSYYDGVGWSPNYIGFCNHDYDYYAETLSYATTFPEAKEAARACQQVFAYQVGSIPVWTRSGVKAYKTSWENVVNMEGYGIDNRWSFLDMYNLLEGQTGTIDYGISSNLDSLNVITAISPYDWKVLDQIYDSLIGRNPYYLAEEYGWLAESWETEALPDGMTCSFTIRTDPDPMFHDGTMVTPLDVAFSLIFTRDCGPGVAWNYPKVKHVEYVEIGPASYVDIHQDIRLNNDLGPRDIIVYLNVESYWVLHWIGFLPIINSDLWLVADDQYGWGFGTISWAPMLVRNYQPWNDDVNGNTIIDLCEDGTGPWVYDSTDMPEDISASTWVLLTANRQYHLTQTEVSDFLGMAFHAIGDIDYDGDIDIVDMMIIARALGTDCEYPWGTEWDEYNPEADIYPCISWPDWILGDCKVDINDLMTAAMNYGKTADC